MSTRQDGTQAVRRVLALLREVSASRSNGASLSVLAEAAGLPTHTAHRLLGALREVEMLVRDGASRLYDFGPLAYEFGLAAASPAAVGNRRPLGVGAGALAVQASLLPDTADEVMAANAAPPPARPHDRARARRCRGDACARLRGHVRAHPGGLPRGGGGHRNGVGGVAAEISGIAVAGRPDAQCIEEVAVLLRHEERALRDLLANRSITEQKGFPREHRHRDVFRPRCGAHDALCLAG